MASSKGRNRRHAHKEKKSGGQRFSPFMSHKVCETCGKQCYESREEAKRSARVNHPGQSMHVYDCKEPTGMRWWHLSSIPASKLSKLRERTHGPEQSAGTG